MRTLIFDLDGTLLNTISDIANACNIILEQNGFPRHEMESYKKMVGNGFEKLMARALPEDAPIKEQEISRLTGLAREYYATHMMVKTEPYDNLPDVLQKLSDNGIELAVLSNKPDNLSRMLVNHYFPSVPFVEIRGAIEGIPLKPDPFALKQMMDIYGWDAAQTAYVGDSNVDMQTAVAACVSGWGAGWGFRGAKELYDAKASLILNSPADLLCGCHVA